MNATAYVWIFALKIIAAVTEETAIFPDSPMAGS
jgi:hypothetical protein